MTEIHIGIELIFNEDNEITKIDLKSTMPQDLIIRTLKAIIAGDAVRRSMDKPDD